MSRPKIRKVNTAKRKKEAKEVQKKLALQASLMMKHPKECVVCKDPFERTHETIKTWHVTVIEEKKKVHLTCPKCWQTISEAVNGY